MSVDFVSFAALTEYKYAFIMFTKIKSGYRS